MQKILLILICFLISWPAFGQDPPTSGMHIGFTQENNYEKVASADDSQIYATYIGPQHYFELKAVAYVPLIDSINFLFRFAGTLDISIDGGQQNLQPSTGPPNKQWNRKMDNHHISRTTASFDLGFWLSHQDYYTMLIYSGFELHESGVPENIYVTHGPNRTAACAAAVNDSIANPALSTDVIQAECEMIETSYEWPLYRLHFGADLIVRKNWLISAKVRLPIEDSSSGYKILKEQAVTIGVSYNFGRFLR